MELELSKIISQIIAFLVMLWVLKRYGWTPLSKILEERRAKILQEFEVIEGQKNDNLKLKGEIESKLKGIEKDTRHIMQEAMQQAQKIASEIQEDAQNRSQAIIEKAKNEIQNEIGKSKQQLRKDIVSMVISTSEKVLQKQLTDRDQEKLVSKFVEESLK